MRPVYREANRSDQEDRHGQNHGNRSLAHLIFSFERPRIQNVITPSLVLDKVT
jgi:hypothetical protein